MSGYVPIGHEETRVINNRKIKMDIDEKGAIELYVRHTIATDSWQMKLTAFLTGSIAIHTELAVYEPTGWTHYTSLADKGGVVSANRSQRTHDPAIWRKYRISQIPEVQRNNCIEFLHSAVKKKYNAIGCSYLYKSLCNLFSIKSLDDTPALVPDFSQVTHFNCVELCTAALIVAEVLQVGKDVNSYQYNQSSDLIDALRYNHSQRFTEVFI
jgi:hypothetical protein